MKLILSVLYDILGICKMDKDSDFPEWADTALEALNKNGFTINR